MTTLDKKIKTAADFLKLVREFELLEAAKGFDRVMSPKINLPKEYQDLEVIPEGTAAKKIMKRSVKLNNLAMT